MNYLLVIIPLCLAATLAAADTPPGHPPIDHKAMIDQMGQSGGEVDDYNLKGTTISVQPVSGYVYIEVAPESGENLWIAVPEDVKVEVGDTIHYKEGPIMKDFLSKSLNTTFPTVMFLSNVKVTGKGD